jgi:hypothetical protein
VFSEASGTEGAAGFPVGRRKRTRNHL